MRFLHRNPQISGGLRQKTPNPPTKNSTQNHIPTSTDYKFPYPMLYDS